jgi:hypothetical protein
VGGAFAASPEIRRRFSSDRKRPPPCFAWSPSPAIAGADARSRSRDAVRTRVIVQELNFFRSPHRSSSENAGGGCRSSSRSVLQATNVRKESKEAERRETRIQPPHPLRGVRRAQSAARSPLGVPPRLLPEGRWSQRLSFRPGFLGRGFPGRYPPVCLSQSSGSTPRTGRNAGEHDAQAARECGDEPPPAGTDSRSAMRSDRMTSLYASEIGSLFSNPERDVTELFPDTTYAHLAGLFALCEYPTSAVISVCSETEDSLGWQWFKPDVVQALAEQCVGLIVRKNTRPGEQAEPRQ